MIINDDACDGHQWQEHPIIKVDFCFIWKHVGRSVVMIVNGDFSNDGNSNTKIPMSKKIKIDLKKYFVDRSVVMISRS